MESVVFFIPDVWSCLPTQAEWSTFKNSYNMAVYGKPSGAGEPPRKDSSASKTKGSSKATDLSNNSITTAPGSLDTSKGKTEAGEVKGSRRSSTKSDQEQTRKDSETDVLKMEGVSESQDNVPDNPDNGELSEGEPPIPGVSNMDVEETVAEPTTEATVESTVEASPQSVTQTDPESTDKEPASADKASSSGTHFSLLDPKNMNVVKLKEELLLRGLSTKGLKSQLTHRLVKTLKEEESREKVVIKTEVVESNEQESEESPLQTNSVAEVEVKSEPVDPTEDKIVANTESSIHTDKDDKMEEGELVDDTPFENTEIISPLKGENKPIKVDVPWDSPILKPDMPDDYKRIWERRYALPKNPRLLVYPSAKAKAGSFDCLTMSLGILRDYRQSDKKEDSFEVSLFAEFFFEMLQRDFGFRIYREVMAQSNKLTQEASKDPNITDADSKDSAIVAEKSHDLRNDLDLTKKRKATGAATIAVKQKTFDPQLLLSFSFYDQAHAGYLTDVDLEDICFAIGVGLNRAQIHRAVHKLCAKGNIFYRKWTDKACDDNSAESGNTTSEVCVNGPSDVESIREIAQGSKSLLPIFVYGMSSLSTTDVISRSNVVNGSSPSEEDDAVLATVDGCLVDVKKLKEKLEKSEKERLATDANFNVAKNTLNDVKNQVMELKKSNEVLKEDLTRTKEMLKKAEATEKSNKEELETFRRASERFCERVKDYIKPVGSTKEKERESTVTVSSEKTAKGKEKDTENGESSVEVVKAK